MARKAAIREADVPAALRLPECDVAADVTPGLYDEKLLRHIFGNLLSNAIKYSPQGRRVARTPVRTSC